MDAARLEGLGPLTDAQRDLAGHPAHLALARRVARRMARRCPRLADEFEAAALAGLVDAARTFIPARGVRFGTHATPRVAGAVKDADRAFAPKGFRRQLRAAPTTLPLWARPDVRPGEADDVVDDRLPVGWEADALAGVEELIRPLPAAHRGVVRAYFTEAGATMKVIGGRVGLTESRVSQLIGEALEWLREGAVA